MAKPSRLKKFLTRFLIFLLVVLVAVFGGFVEYYRVYQVNPYALSVDYQTFSDPRIPSSMDQVSVVYFSDLEYGQFIHEGHLDALFGKIQELDPDILLFGGDLFASQFTVNTAASDLIGSYFRSIEAPLGKFAVYGEQDLIDANRKNYVDQLYFASQVEVIDNSSRLLANRTREGVRLIGLNIQADVSAATAGLDNSTFNIVLSHYPDHLLYAGLEGVAGYGLAGNAHGTQITWPLVGGYRLWPGSTELNRASYRRLSFDYTLTSGIGCIEVNARMNATPSISYFLFK